MVKLGEYYQREEEADNYNLTILKDFTIKDLSHVEMITEFG